MTPRRAAWSKLCRNRIGMTALAVVALYLAVAIGIEILSFACKSRGVIAPWDVIDDAACYQPPSAQWILGTDYQGRSVLLRAIAGIATAAKVGLIAGLIAAVIGTTLGAVAGYRGGRFDDLVVWLYSTFASMPTLLFILAFALLISREHLSPALAAPVSAVGTILGTEPGMIAVYVAIGLTGWVTLCRTVRAETMKIKNLPFVAAATVAGVTHTRIILRHIIPNVFHLVIIYFTLNFAGAVMLEVIVSYLGFGVQSAPSWGVMISDGQERLWRGIWWELASATSFMFVFVLALNVLGDALRDALDPRQ